MGFVAALTCGIFRLRFSFLCPCKQQIAARFVLAPERGGEGDGSAGVATCYQRIPEY
jgi:hypothetical protein